MDLREWLVSLSFAEKDFDDIFGDSQEWIHQHCENEIFERGQRSSGGSASEIWQGSVICKYRGQIPCSLKYLRCFDQKSNCLIDLSAPKHGAVAGMEVRCI
jgi:hypothetical protein